MTTGAMRPYDPQRDDPRSEPGGADLQTLETLLRQVAAVSLKAPERQRETLDASAGIEAQVVALAAEVKNLKDRLKTAEDELSESGEHRIKDIIRERDELKASRTHWLRYGVSIIVGMLVALAMMGIGKFLK